MKLVIIKRYLCLTILILVFLPLAADKYAGEIFHYGMGVRNLALGSTGLTNLNSNSAAWWNAALLEYKTENALEIMHAEDYEGLLQYDSFSGIYGRDKKFGIVLSRIGINDIPLTKLENDSLEIGNDNRPYAYEYVNNSDLAVFLGFYQKLGNYTLGFAPKLAWRSLAKEQGFGFGADLAITSDPGKAFVYAIQVRDFFTTRIFWGNGTDEKVLPSVNLEASYGLSIPLVNLRSRVYLRPEIFFEGRQEAAAFSFSEGSMDLHAGLETAVTENFDFLAGYDIDHFTTGLAIKYSSASILYCFELEPELDNSHRIALAWRF